MLNWRIAVPKLNQDKDKTFHMKTKCVPQWARKNDKSSVHEAEVSSPLHLCPVYSDSVPASKDCHFKLTNSNWLWFISLIIFQNHTNL